MAVRIFFTSKLSFRVSKIQFTCQSNKCMKYMHFLFERFLKNDCNNNLFELLRNTWTFCFLPCSLHLQVFIPTLRNQSPIFEKSLRKHSKNYDICLTRHEKYYLETLTMCFKFLFEFIYSSFIFFTAVMLHHHSSSILNSP